MEINTLQTHIERLESRFEFQEQTIDELNSALIKQQLLINTLEAKLALIAKKVFKDENENESMLAPLSEESPPPHY